MKDGSIPAWFVTLTSERGDLGLIAPGKSYDY